MKSVSTSIFTGTVIKAPNMPIVTEKLLTFSGPSLNRGGSLAIWSPAEFSNVNSRMFASIVVKNTAHTQVSRSILLKAERGVFVATENQRWPSVKLLWVVLENTCLSDRSSWIPATLIKQSTCHVKNYLHIITWDITILSLYRWIINNTYKYSY